jgi:hypothetical protein
MACQKKKACKEKSLQALNFTGAGPGFEPGTLGFSVFGESNPKKSE